MLSKQQNLYFGFQPVEQTIRERFRLYEVDQQVDNFTRFSPVYGYESTLSVVSLGLRQTRFAPLLFWEIFHLLSPGGVWLDLDRDERCQGTPLSAFDFLDREYYRTALESVVQDNDKKQWQLYRKTQSAIISDDMMDDGWTFGILTAGPSVRAQEMIRTILDLQGPEREIIICGPAQENLTDDTRIRVIDLEQPEPRGWITRKKNLIVDNAQFRNLCLMHDRFVFPPDFFSVMGKYGNDFAFVTFPEPYYPHDSRCCALRYPDYQVLLQDGKYQEAIDSCVFQLDNVYHPRYDDFYETAFCCGGVYVTKKSLWNMVRQNESLYHAECEDILFGLQSQQLGIPHRMIADTIFESLAPHPFLLAGMHTVTVSGVKHRDFPVVSHTQKKKAAQNPKGCHPVFGCTRWAYYQRVLDLFNAIALLPESCRLTLDDFNSPQRLSDFWLVVYQHLIKLPVNRRDDIASIYYFLSAAVFSWPNSIIQTWIRETELQLARNVLLPHDKKLIGWGTGSVYRNITKRNPIPLSYLIDNDSRRWNERLNGFDIREPKHLQHESPTSTFVIIYSSFDVEIGRQIEKMGLYSYCKASDLLEKMEYLPIVNLIDYFLRIEKDYPRLFIDSLAEKEPTIHYVEEDKDRKTFLNSEIASTLLVVKGATGLLPPIG